MKRRIRRLAGVIFAGLPVMASVAAHSQPLESFYRGKTISLIVGGSPGGRFDAYARTVAGHIGKHLPGGPQVMVRNVPGQASLRAATYLFTAAPKDGSVIGAIFPDVIMEPLLGDRDKVPFAPRQFNFLGSAHKDVAVCVARRGTRFKSFRSAFRGTVYLGAASRGGPTRDSPFLMNNLLGARFKVQSRYGGDREAVLAAAQGGVQGVCGYAWSVAEAGTAEWMKGGKMRVLVQIAMEGDPVLTRKRVPMIWDFVKTPRQRDALELFVSQFVFARPYVAPPGVPSERVEALRAAFAKTMADPEFLAEAAESGLDIDPATGGELQKLIEKLYKTPPGVVQRARRALQPSRR